MYLPWQFFALFAEEYTHVFNIFADNPDGILFCDNIGLDCTESFET